MAQDEEEWLTLGVAAVLNRQYTADQREFLESLAGLLERCLPGQVEVKTQCRPLELAMGNCVYHVGRRGFRQALGQLGKNIEMPNYTQGLYNARELALDRMQAEAQRVGANGIVGVDVTQSSFGWGSHVLEFFALGTAVHRDGSVPKAPDPSFVLTLNDPPRPVPQPVRPPMPTHGGSVGGE